jgi:hypothetical protein
MENHTEKFPVYAGCGANIVKVLMNIDTGEVIRLMKTSEVATDFDKKLASRIVSKRDLYYAVWDGTKESFKVVCLADALSEKDAIEFATVNFKLKNARIHSLVFASEPSQALKKVRK